MLPTIQIAMNGFYSVLMVLKYAIEQIVNFGSIKSILFPLLEETNKSFNSNSLSKIKEQNIKWNRALKIGSFW